MNVIKRYTGIGGGIQTPDKLIIHGMAEIIQVDQSFKRKGKIVEVGKYGAHEWLVLLGLSAHFLIEPNGEVIKQRSTKEICWHARGFNTGSVGIEVLVEGVWNYETFKEKIKKDWVTVPQYDFKVSTPDLCHCKYALDDLGGDPPITMPPTMWLLFVNDWPIPIWFTSLQGARNSAWRLRTPW